MILLFLYFQAPLGPIGKKAPLGPIKKLAPLGTIDNPPLAPLGSLRSESLEKTKLSETGKQNSRDSDTESIGAVIMSSNTERSVDDRIDEILGIA